jgi:TPR repeat protein
MKKGFGSACAAIDCESPWTLRQRHGTWSNGYRTSTSEWRSLLARAKSGDPEAEWGIADRYADGCKDNRGKIIVRRSATKAAEWFRRAAEHGSAPAQNTLGGMLSNGDGVRKNIDQALLWLKKAYRSGISCAAQNIAITYRENGDLKAAVKWFRKAASAREGDGDALVELGIHYYWGKGVRKDATAAVDCFRRATKSKNICGFGRDDAFFLLGIAYCEGRGVRVSIPNARKMFERANIDGDHSLAATMLSQLQP